MGDGCRVLILNERDLRNPKAGGAEVHVHDVFGRLATRGHEVTLLAAGFPGAAARERVGNIEVRRLGPLPAYYTRVPFVCARATRGGEFDVVVECLNKVPFYSPLYSAVPVLALCHHLFGETAFQQVAWPFAAAVWSAERLLPLVYRKSPFVAISESSRRDLVGRGLAAEHIRVSRPGTDPPRVVANTQRVRPRRVAYVGRIEPYKRVDVLLRAMARIDRFPDAEILVIGRGSAAASLEALARELGLAHRTRFTGFVDDRQRDALLAATRVCVCPSAKEGWGLTVIESNALGAPVVASDVPGLRDSVRHGETGFLVPYGDIDAFAERIATLLADDALALRTSRAAVEWARGFDAEVCATEMEDALEAARRGT